MGGIENFGLFVVSAMLLCITPGPDTFYILGRTMAGGKMAGAASVLGISAGLMVHTLAACVGLSAILATSGTAFALVKLAGAVYLIYLGVSMILSRGEGVSGAGDKNGGKGFWLTFRQGVITNVLNPKVALFYLSFLPQFVVSGGESHILPFMILGGTLIATGTIWCLFLVFSASALMGFLGRDYGFMKCVNRWTGALFVGLGFNLALSK